MAIFPVRLTGATIGGLLALTLLLLAVLPATAQSPALPADASPTEALMRSHISQQHVVLLQSPDSRIREQAMRNIITLTHRDRSAYDWSAAGPVLVQIYANDTNDPLRIMAVSALYTIQDQRFMDAINRRNAVNRAAHATRSGSLTYVPSHVEHIGDRAVRMYYHERALAKKMARDQRRLDRHLAKAARHTQKAERYQRQMRLAARPLP